MIKSVSQMTTLPCDDVFLYSCGNAQNMSINPVTLKKYYLILGNISFGWKMLADNLVAK
jgi:hypothetical protein